MDTSETAVLSSSLEKLSIHMQEAILTLQASHNTEARTKGNTPSILGHISAVKWVIDKIASSSIRNKQLHLLGPEGAASLLASKERCITSFSSFLSELVGVIQRLNVAIGAVQQTSKAAVRLRPF